MKKIETVSELLQVNNLNQKYTFDEFISGASNRFAYEAARAVSANPGTAYNPLVIYSGAGVGKTHLLNAIGNAILEENPQMRICYHTTEAFMNKLINARRCAKMDDFRNNFRSMDVLLIDDVQFMTGKEQTREELLCTFTFLYENRKQIVVAADRSPKDIPCLEGWIRSRFEWGLITDIQAPDMETRLAVLKQKAEQNGIDLPENVTFFLADSISSSIWELEACLIRIVNYSGLTATPITLPLAKTVLMPGSPPASPGPQIR